MTMIQHLRSAALPFVFGILTAVPVAAQYPAEPGTGIADLASIIDPSDEDRIRATIEALQRDPGVEVRVLTVPDIDRYRTGDPTPEAFATAVYNAWRVGYGYPQDGVLVLVSQGDRFARIELGDHVPTHHEPRMQVIMDQHMIPRLTRGEYSMAVWFGVREIAASFRAQATSAPASRTGGGSGNGMMLIWVAAPLVLGALGAAWHLRRQPRKCRACGRGMQLLSEAEDLAYLDAGQRLERRLESVRHDVWHCGGCGARGTDSRRIAGSGREACPQCRYRTVTVRRTPLEPATLTAEGRDQRVRVCEHCGWRHEDVVAVSRLQEHDATPAGVRSGFGTRSSGGGWSGGRSFGGGQSGGGFSSGRGASGRW
jgi:uncharacterized protein